VLKPYDIAKTIIKPLLKLKLVPTKTSFFESKKLDLSKVRRSDRNA